MERLHIAVWIDASREEVWDAMLDPESYAEWKAAFAEGSFFEGSWGEGEMMRFLTPQHRGTLARIAVFEPHEYISIEHVGIVKDGIEDTDSDEVREWAPAYENYTLIDDNSATEVRLDVDLIPGQEDEMGRLWPRALAHLKLICEDD